MNKNSDYTKRWLALYVLCLGSLMIVLDVTIVNVALPSIKVSLGFSETSLAWVLNAYLLTFGGFLLLGGRLGDIYGPRKLFLIGLTLFTLASLICGLSTSQGILVAARALQGFGGAIVSAVSLSLTMDLFTKQEERAKAMGIFGFVAAGGGSIGVFLGGILTSLRWHWIFLVNIPVGVLVITLSFFLLPKTWDKSLHRNLDIAGAISITLALMLAVYAITNGSSLGWTSLQTLGLLASSIFLLLVFLLIESKVKSPLMQLKLLRHQNLAAANVCGILWAASMFTFFFLSALYLQVILGLKPFLVGLSFLPSNIIMAIFSLGFSAKIVMHFGIRKTLATGLLFAAAGILLFVRSPIHGSLLLDVMPSMILLGIGAGIAFNPILLAAMSDVKPEESGLASGIINTSFMMGGALGLSILSSLAAARTNNLIASGQNNLAAVNNGYHLAFLIGAILALLSALIGTIYLRIKITPESTLA